MFAKFCEEDCYVTSFCCTSRYRTYSSGWSCHCIAAIAHSVLEISCGMNCETFSSAAVAKAVNKGLSAFTNLAHAQVEFAISCVPNSATRPRHAKVSVFYRGRFLALSFAIDHAVAAMPCGEALHKASSASASSRGKSAFMAANVGPLFTKA